MNDQHNPTAGVEPAVSQSVETAPQAEQSAPSTPEPVQATDAANFNEETRKSIKLSAGNLTDDQKMYQEYKFALLNACAQTLANEVEASWGDIDNEERLKRIAELTSLVTPKDIGSIIANRPGSDWNQYIDLPGGGRAAIRKGGGGTRAMSLISSLTGDGESITMLMPASGIYVEFKAPKEEAFCDFDFKVSQDQGYVGLDTSGMLLSAASVVNSAHQFNFALDHAINASIVHSKDNLANTLRARIKSQDLVLFNMGPLIAMFIGGFPFELTCPVGKCNHREDILLGLARIVNYDRNMLTEKQLDILAKYNTMGGMPESVYDEYQKDHKLVTESRVLIGEPKEGFKVYLELEECSAGFYISEGNEWINKVEDNNNIVMSNFATETQRRQHIELRGEVNKLLRYQHLFGSIVAIETETGDVVERIDDRAKVLAHMEKMTGKSHIASRIQSDIVNFIAARQISLLGFMAEKCAECGHKAEKGNEFVSISPDLLFFMLSQAVSSVQQVAAEVQRHLR